MKLNPKEAPKGYVARETRETYGCASCAPKRPRRTAAPEGKDICSRCGRVQTYGTMKAISEDSFDLLCAKCRRPRHRIKRIEPNNAAGQTPAARKDG